MTNDNKAVENKTNFWNGFFWALGFGDSPSSYDVIRITEKESSDKIKDDLAKIKNDLRKSYRELVSECR